MAKKDRVHREWFRKISKTTCPCGCKKKEVYSWGQYIRARWNTVKYFCSECFSDIKNDLLDHKGDCGCSFELIGYQGQRLPDWLNLNQEACEVKQAA